MMLLLVSHFCSMTLMWVMLRRSSSMHTVWTSRRGLSCEVRLITCLGMDLQSLAPWGSPCLLVPKSDGTARFCNDYWKVNAVTIPDCFPLPCMEDCVDNLGSAQYVSKLDLLKRYCKCPLPLVPLIFQIFPDSFLQYSVMAFGMHNVPATFQRLIIVLSGVSNCNAYLDDLVVYSTDWSEHVSLLRTVFEGLANASLTLNSVKCEFSLATITHLGKEVGQGQVRPLEAKVTAIAEFSISTTGQELRRFLGMAGYYCSFCNNFSIIVQPLTLLLSPSCQFLWSDECQHVLHSIQTLLCSAPVLIGPNLAFKFKLEVDASAVGAGIDYPVCYFSRKFNNHQVNYSTIEKKALALLIALQYFDVYIRSSNYPVVNYP